MALPILSPASVLARAAGRQGLGATPLHGDIPGLARCIVGLHASEPTSIFLSAWARLSDFDLAAMERALYDDHSVVRWLAMRRTLWVVAAQDAPLVHQATVPRLRGPEERRLHRLMVLGELTDEAGASACLAAIEAELLSVLAERGPSSSSELAERVPALRTTYPYALDKPYGGHFSLGSRIHAVLCMRGGMVRARPLGGWRSNQYRYALREAWLPGVDLGVVEPDPARAELVRRYLEAFGPASLDDIQWWTGLTRTQVRAAVQALGEALVSVRVRGEEGEQLLTAEALDAARQASALDPCLVSLLPTLDPWVMATKQRRRLMSEQSYTLLHDRNGNAGPSVLAGGRVVGGWVQREDGRVVWQLFEEIGTQARRALEERAARLEQTLAEERVMPSFPTPLMQQLRG